MAEARVYCEDCQEQKYWEVSEPYDENEKPPGCETHTVRDYVVDEGV